MKVRRDDNVLLIAGKDRGKKGKVLKVLVDEDRVVVEGVNLVKRHQRAVPGARQAGIIQKEAGIHVSNVMLLCSKCNKPVRMGSKVLEDGHKVRVCRSCHEVIS